MLRELWLKKVKNKSLLFKNYNILQHIKERLCNRLKLILKWKGILIKFKIKLKVQFIKIKRIKIKFRTNILFQAIKKLNLFKREYPQIEKE